MKTLQDLEIYTFSSYLKSHPSLELWPSALSLHLLLL